VVRERQPGDSPCPKLAILGLEGELFFGAAPDLEEHLGGLLRRTGEGLRVAVLRLKRVRNPDMVCLEILERCFHDMRGRGVPVLVCGVRPDFAQALRNVGADKVLPPEDLFLEDAAAVSSTLRAVRRAYEILGDDRCPDCPQRAEAEKDKGEWY